MAHVGIMCPNVGGYVYPMIALADALRVRGHRATFFLLGEGPSSVTEAGFEVRDLGGALFPAQTHMAGLQCLGALSGRAALEHTQTLLTRATHAVLTLGPALLRDAGVSALVVDQLSFAGGTVADRLDVPFATVSNALLLNAEPDVPPYFTTWQPHDAWWARVRNTIGWAGLNKLYAPILRLIQEHCSQYGIDVPTRIADVWSSTVHISQQPEGFDFPRRELPPQLRFVGPLRIPGGYPPVPFPWDRLDGRPLIYATLGTVQNRAPATFRNIARACGGLDAQLVMSTGHGVAPGALGALPGDPIVVDFAPQLELIRKAALTVTHAGLNTVLDALSAAVPMVAVPITNDQPGVAGRVRWSGAGETLTLNRLTPRRLSALVRQVLEDPRYRAAAERLRRSIQAGGGAPRAAEIIEDRLGLGPGTLVPDRGTGWAVGERSPAGRS